MEFLEKVKLALEDVYVVLFNAWLWVIIGVSIAIMVTPIIIVLAFFYLPQPLQVVATILVVVGWGVAGGYKEWASHRQKEEKIRIREAE